MLKLNTNNQLDNYIYIELNVKNYIYQIQQYHKII